MTEADSACAVKEVDKSMDFPNAKEVLNKSDASTREKLRAAKVLSASKNIEDRILITDVLEQIMHEESKELAEEARDILDPKIDGRRLTSVWVIRGDSANNSSIIELTDEEVRKIKNKEPFVITNENEMRLRKVFRAAVKQGLIKPTVITTAKRFDKYNDLMYARYLRKISSKYNGNITFVLSVEDADILKHDLCGGFSSIIALIKTLGRDYYFNNLILQITDGGMKERTGNLIALYRQQGLFTYPGRQRAVEELFTTLGLLSLSYPDGGINDRFWTANDTHVRFANLKFGGKPLKDLPEDREMIFYGKARKIIEKRLAEKVFSVVEDAGGWDNLSEDKLCQDDEMKELLDWIQDEQLPRRGVYTAEGTKLEWFEEKPSRLEILRQAAKRAKDKNGEIKDGYLSENIFLMTMHKDNLDFDLISRLAFEPTTDGRKKFELEVSVFRTLIAARFLPEDELDKLRFDDPNRPCCPTDWKELVNVGKENIANSNLIGAADYGDSLAKDVGRIADVLEKWRKSIENVEGTVSEDVHIASDATVEGKNYILREVNIHGRGTLVLEDGVIIENSNIYLSGGQTATVSEGSVVVDSDLKGDFKFFGKQSYLFGVHFSPGEIHDLAPSGEWKPAETLEVYGDELLVGLDRFDGKSYIARSIASLPYKRRNIGSLIGKENWSDWCKKHPRLLGVPGLSEWDDVQATDFLGLPHYFGEKLSVARKKLNSKAQLARVMRLD